MAAEQNTVELAVLGSEEVQVVEDESDRLLEEPSEPSEPSEEESADITTAGSWFCRPCSFIQALNGAFGFKILVLLFTSQHLVKGLLMTLVGTPMSFIYRSKNVAGPRMQIYSGVTSLPWAMKPMVGFISDYFPIRGLSKAPYLLVAAICGLVATSLVAFMPLEAVPTEVIACCFFMIMVEISTVDLLTEAKYAEKMHSCPKQGPNLMTYVWFGMTFAGFLGTIAIGPILQHFGNQLPYMLALVPAASVLVPVWLGYLEEERQLPLAVAERRRQMWRQPLAAILVLVMFVGTVLLSVVGIVFQSVALNATVAIGVALVVLIAYSVCLTPVIAKVNAFFLIQMSLSLGTGGASFYFMTDGPTQYAEGPHFSKEFYTSVLGVVGSLTSMVGIWSYNKYMQHWTYHRLLMLTNIVAALLAMLDVVFFMRLNVRLGIDDRVFVMGSSVSQTIVGQWMWMPGVVILAQLCPKGMEATMYALLAGCHNLGGTISSSCGALMLQWLGVQPSGADDESAMFDKLWIASAISSVLPVFTLVLLPWMIPNASQKDALLNHEHANPFVDSILDRWGYVKRDETT